jgi:putative PIN family toxin of toxin-antitoxin system
VKIVLDTNVIVAAFASRGLCAEIFEICLTDHGIVISEHILSEIEENLIKKIRLPRNIVQNIIDYLKSIAEIIEPEPANESICRDKNDSKIIGTALSGGAGFIITGDEDLLVLKRHKGVKIINPREFWNILRQ